MIACEDKELFAWCTNASVKGGSFIKEMGWAGLRADPANYAIIRPALLELKKKYPDYYREEFAKMVDEGAYPENLEAREVAEDLLGDTTLDRERYEQLFPGRQAEFRGQFESRFIANQRRLKSGG